MNRTTIEDIKQAMNYVEDTECCSSCEYFRKEESGDYFRGPQHEPKENRCVRNVIEVPVSVGGRCDLFTKREPLIRLESSEPT